MDYGNRNLTQNIKYGSNTTLKEFIKKFHHDKLLRELEYVEKKISERENRLIKESTRGTNQPLYGGAEYDEFMYKINSKGNLLEAPDDAIQEQVRTKLNRYKVSQKSSVIGKVILNKDYS